LCPLERANLIYRTTLSPEETNPAAEMFCYSEYRTMGKDKKLSNPDLVYLFVAFVVISSSSNSGNCTINSLDI
jgi:hypothetical protein